MTPHTSNPSGRAAESTETTPTSNGRAARRRGTAIGVVGGLLAGTAAGLIIGVPGLSSAAPAAPTVVAQVDDVEPDADATDAPSERPDFSERLRATLDPLVTDGTITATQADAVADHLVAERPERDGRRGPGRGHRGAAKISETVTDVLGVDQETLREELRSGSSLADIAAAQDVDVQTLVDALVDDAEARLDAAVEAGKITADDAAAKADTIEEMVTARVNGERPARGPSQPEG